MVHLKVYPAKTIRIALINRALQGMITSGLVAGFITKTGCFPASTMTNRDKYGNEKAPGVGAGGGGVVVNLNPVTRNNRLLWLRETQDLLHV
jgi:hypothetical protein